VQFVRPHLCERLGGHVECGAVEGEEERVLLDHGVPRGGEHPDELWLTEGTGADEGGEAADELREEPIGHQIARRRSFEARPLW